MPSKRRDVFGSRSAAVLKAIAAGASTADAARASKVGVRTVKDWLEKGRRDPDGRYGAFAQAVDGCREARTLPAPEVLAAMDEDELALVVSQAAREGNVTAMRLRWEQLRAEPVSLEPVTEADKILAEMDELAARRRQRGGDG